MEKPSVESLVEFPCDYLFKVFGPAAPDAEFAARVRRGVEKTVPVPLDAMKTRLSSRGAYVAVSVLVRLHNFQQLTDIYADLRRLDGLRYLL